MLRVRTLDLAVSAMLFLLGFYIIASGIGFGVIDSGTPGAGFFPVIVGAGIVLFSGINCLKVLRQNAMLSEIIGTTEIMRVVLTSIALIAFCGLASPLGMLVSGFGLMVTIAIIFGARTPDMIGRAALAAAVMSGVLYLIFVKFLAVALP
ncbi:tripartite tricarboxylate transporter TctB family protein [Paracoccus aestuariivivens]|uniref:DUF1468 domain-containing protein n=1 Tax=Paracoccus aestuariivivens TaxID=1820333 RepID=A0A6L6JEE2_9RHOB|nr:tripartite tricarboxylate transporter TctB family protein [Paracoccus aestuariivivens]MTH78534.1 hypothetical protein [Paracoccus aestuariivivens]